MSGNTFGKLFTVTNFGFHVGFFGHGVGDSRRHGQRHDQALQEQGLVLLAKLTDGDSEQ